MPKENLNLVRLLRLDKEPCAYFQEEEIHQTLIRHINDFMDSLEKFYQLWSKNKVIVTMPRKQVFTTPGIKGDLRVMPCMIDNFKGRSIKIVKIIGTNEEQSVIKDKISVGKAMLIHNKDNFVEAIFDVCSFSSFRTAAISILVYKHSAYAQTDRIGLVGIGRVGFYTAAILNSWLKIKKLAICDSNQKHIANFKQSLKNRPRLQIEEQKLSQLCRLNNAVFLSTDSSRPILSANNASNLSFISSVGADADNLSELDSSLIKNRQIITESKQNIYFGELKRWSDAGLITKSQIIEFPKLLSRKKIIGKHKIFISAGTAVQDAITCGFLYEYLKKRNKIL